MLKTLLVATIGEEHYRDACAFAWREAERDDYGRGDRGEDDHSLVPHELSDALWESDAPLDEKIWTLFAIYDEMPAYGLLMYVSHHYPDWPAAARQQFWDGVRLRLAGSDRALARPLAYNLWCNWFEHQDHTVEAWEALTTPATPAPALQEVLIASGPVPWQMKTGLYSRLVPEMAWHYYIFRSLLHSAFDVYGQLDRAEGAAWLDRLSLPPATEHLSELQARLHGAEES